MAPRIAIEPPLLNAACPWATDLEYLRSLYASPSTGAITTRTSLVNGYPHDDVKNTFVFFDPSNPAWVTGTAPPFFPLRQPGLSVQSPPSASLNSFGLSPLPLSSYLCFVRTLVTENPGSSKLIIISVTGETPESNSKAVKEVIALAKELRDARLAIEVNLSCPNVPGRPPPAFDAEQLEAFLSALPSNPPLPVGIKTTPYTHDAQFAMVVSAVAAAQPKVSFITATNALGFCTVLGDTGLPSLPTEGGLGGMAGPPIHPLALGNVATLRKLLDRAMLENVDIIGVGGVNDTAGYKRMIASGAKAVGIATALGEHGVGIFEQILSRSEPKL